MFDKYTLKKKPNDHFQESVYDMAIAKNKLWREYNSGQKIEKSQDGMNAV